MASPLETRTWLGCGAPVRPARARLSLTHPRAAWPVDVRPASGELRAGKRDPDSTAGSIAEGRTDIHTLYASTNAFEGVELWHGSNHMDYRGECPRERTSPQGSSERMLITFSPGVHQNWMRQFSLKTPPHWEQDKEFPRRKLRRKKKRRRRREENRFRNVIPKETNLPPLQMAPAV